MAGDIGRTPEDEVFEVPASHDMLHTLLDPRLPKTRADCATVALLMVNFWLYWVLPGSWRTPVFFLLFAFWRSAYNAGLGWLLQQQSERRTLTKWARRHRIFDNSATGWRKLLASEVGKRLNTSAGQAQVPIEYKTWILFRLLVDLVLMSDFITYCLLGLSCFHATEQPWIITIGRWICGAALILFNLWVKVDAHRVVKDYAWFWGDFFFLKDGQLTFDGVFELAPHPMYTIGYAGYYGLSLLTASPTLFVASVLAHAAQFAFLCIVENPHIDRTYPPPPAAQEDQDIVQGHRQPHIRPMLGLAHFNFTRPCDIELVALVVTHSLMYLFPSSRLASALTVGLALAWRSLHTIGLGTLLRKQSETKLWTRLFLKYGYTREDGYQQWQGLYNVTTVMSYVSLLVVAAREYSGLSLSYALFRHILGAMLVSLHVWTSWSIWEALGEFGWFFGDFFVPPRHTKLSVSGIYRYLNHPERIAGVIGIWGGALITGSMLVVLLGAVWTLYNLAFIQYVEKPHMMRLYGPESVHKMSGVSRNWQKARPLWLESIVIRLWHQTVLARIERIEELKPRVEGIVGDTRQKLRIYHPTEIALSLLRDVDRTATFVGAEKTQYKLGEPIKVTWKAPNAVNRRNWIGIYRVKDRPGSSTTTRISSSGRWSGTDPTGYSDHIRGILEAKNTYGVVELNDEALFWSPGIYELRLHYDGKHQVLAVSTPIEVVVETRNDALKLSETDLADQLSKLAATCGYSWATGDNIRLARFTSALQSVWGIDLAPFVVDADNDAPALARRVQNYVASLN